MSAPLRMLAGALFATVASSQDVAPRDAIVSVERIWDRAQHNAFTDLVRFRGELFCAFREGSGHVPGSNGTVRVIATADGQNWRSVALLDERGVDLRDPKLSVTPDGRLMIVMAASTYDGATLVRRDPRAAFSDENGASIGAPVPIRLPEAIRGDTDWLWRVTWHAGVGYGVVYQPGETEWGLHLVATRDGVAYEHVTELELDGKPNETTLRVLPDGRMAALVRREGADKVGQVGVSSPPFTEWRWSAMDRPLGGPNFVVLPNGTWIAVTRQYGKGGNTTVLGRLHEDGTFENWIRLPSGGDTSYAGLQLDGERLLVSYYSSHEGRTSIYLATLRVAPLMGK